MFYSEKRELVRLRKEVHELETKLAKVIGHKIIGNSFNTVQLNIISGQATIQLIGDKKIHHVQKGDTFTVAVPPDLWTTITR